MAIIANLNNDEPWCHYLNAYHCVGRSITNVNTVIDAPEISRTHAVIEWVNGAWFIRDVSHNGTWINTQKLIKDRAYKLNMGDKMFFAKAQEHGFKVQDVAPPQNMLFIVEPVKDNAVKNGLINIKKSLPPSPIVLTDDNFLPSEDAPEIALFYVKSRNQWYKEHLIDTDGVAYPMSHLDTFTIAGNVWQLKLNGLNENTVKLEKPKLLPHQVAYCFDLSQNEENTKLTIKVGDKGFDLLAYTHHYLTLSLARHRNNDAQRGIDQYNQGWISRETLATELGFDIPHLNIQLHRARSQIQKVLGGVCDENTLFERKRGEIRFAGSVCRIYHGGRLTVNSGHEPLSFTTLHG